MPFLIEKTDINDLLMITSKTFPDKRGFFKELYKKSDFLQHHIPEFVQDNYSVSQKNVIRGLHFQKSPRAQGKLVQVLNGAVWDVAVDLRTDSPTYCQWFATELRSDEHKMLFIPPGFAHGFLALTDNCYVIYKCTSEYSAEHDAGIIWNDPTLNVQWPVNNGILSDKDLQLPEYKDTMGFQREAL